MEHDFDTDNLLQSIGVIEPGDLVIYHGSIPDLHGLWLAVPCLCPICLHLDDLGIADVRYALVDPWQELSGPHHVRAQSVTRSTAS